MRAASDDELYEALIDALPYLPGGPEIAAKLDEEKRAQLRAAIPGLKERAKTLVELLDGAGFLFATRPLAMDEKAEEILARAGRIHLKNLLPHLVAVQTGRRGARGRRARLRRGEGREARRRRAAAARCAHRPLTSPGIFDVLGAGPRGEPRADRRSGGVEAARPEWRSIFRLRLHPLTPGALPKGEGRARVATGKGIQLRMRTCNGLVRPRIETVKGVKSSG